MSNFKSEAMFAKLVELNVVPLNAKNIELEGAWLAIKAADSDSTWYTDSLYSRPKFLSRSHFQPHVKLERAVEDGCSTSCLQYAVFGTPVEL